MKLSLRSKWMSEEILAQRKQMIKSEKLHIKDKITIQEFKNLYKKYGLALEEKDFAWAFLDVNEINHEKLAKGKVLECTILSYEYIAEDEFKTIRENLIQEYQLKNKDEITYNQLLEMYDKFSGKLSMKLFLEEILGMKVSDMSLLKTGKRKSRLVNFDAHQQNEELPMYILNPDYVETLREKLVLEADLRIGKNISYMQLQELNKQYCSVMPEPLFAQRIIGMTAIQYNSLKSRKTEKTINSLVFQDVDISSEYINNVVREMIEKYQLEPGQILQYDKFQKLYEEYGGVLSEKNFAVLVLEISNESYQHFKLKNVSILSSRKGTNLDIIRSNIIRTYKLHSEDKIRYPQFKELHQRYAPNVPEVIFAEKIFGIIETAFQYMKYNGGETSIYFTLPNPDEMKELQRKVILENKIHINDQINYEKLEKLHRLYGGVISIRMFATEILGIHRDSFYRISNNRDENALVLQDLEITDFEIEKVKQKILLECGIQGLIELSMKEINNLYATYSGIMPFVKFRKEVLGISRGSFSNLKHKRKEKAIACIREKFNPGEIQQIRKYLAEGIPEAKIAEKMDVTIEFLKVNLNKLIEAGEITDSQILYERVKLLNDKGITTEEILKEINITRSALRKMLARYNEEKIEEQEGREERREQNEANKKELKRKDELERKARNVLKGYQFTNRNIKIVRNYITECEESFAKGKFIKENLNFLMECLIFVQCNSKEIEFFCKMCIYFNEYEIANNFIIESIDNEGIKPEQKAKLIKLQENIKAAIRKEKIIRMLRRGEHDTKQIAEDVGVSEVEVLRIRKKLNEERIMMLRGKDNPEAPIM